MVPGTVPEASNLCRRDRPEWTDALVSSKERQKAGHSNLDTVIWALSPFLNSLHGLFMESSHCTHERWCRCYPTSQIRKLWPEVTQLMAELQSELGLVTLQLLFLLSALVPPFIGVSYVLGPVRGTLPVFSILFMTALSTGPCLFPSIVWGGREE